MSSSWDDGAVDSRLVKMNAAKEARMAFLEDAWDTNRFSDINICCLNRMYRLHKVVLMQSPFFKRMLLSETNQELIIVEGFLSLECGNDHRITKEGMEISLHDLYDPTLTHHRTQTISPLNAFSVLPSACFLELTDLASHCASVILTYMSRDTIVDFAVNLDTIKPPRKVPPSSYGVAHRYWDVLAGVHGVLEESVLGFCVGLVNGYLGDGEGEDEGVMGTKEDPTTLLLTSLPLLWVRRILESDHLCVPHEYARYELIKRVVKARRGRVRVKGEIDLEQEVAEQLAVQAAVKVAQRLSLGGNRRESGGSGSGSGDGEGEGEGGGVVDDDGGVSVGQGVLSEGVSRLRQYFGSILGLGKRKRGGEGEDDVGGGGLSGDEESGGGAENVGTSHGTPRKIARKGGVGVGVSVRGTESPRSGTPDLTSQSRTTRAITPSTRRSPTTPNAPEDTIMATVFQTAVIYTYMTFPQLELVKRDRIVPDTLVLQSFWAQAELANCASGGGGGGNGAVFPPFRFCVRFRDVRGWFFGRGGFGHCFLLGWLFGVGGGGVGGGGAKWEG
ncbi:hypothetical protein HDV00_008078 [Rhizophlyctis rosea]|nr:hypothetical protein HDV00_008078 [Rhizophlyctis rosea]